MQLENNLVFANTVHREYKKEFVKVGDSVNIRKPVKFVTSDGAARVNQDVEEKNDPITIDQRKHVSWNFSTQDLTLTVEQYSERYIKPRDDYACPDGRLQLVVALLPCMEQRRHTGHDACGIHQPFADRTAP